MRAQLLSHVRLFAIPWTAACQAPLSMGFSRQDYWSGLPFLSLGDFPISGIKPKSPVSPALAGGFFITETYKTESLCCTAEVNTTLQINCTSTTITKKIK